MNDRTPLRQWLENFDSGCYASKDVDIQVKAGFYDWFCRNTALQGKTKALDPKVKRLAKSSKINQDTMYVWFKNNCPMVGRLYDDFRFADIETGNVIYTVIPHSGHNSKYGMAEVWGRENDFVAPLVSGTWKDVLAFFGV